MKGWKQNFFTIWAGQAFSQFSSSVLQFAIVWYLTDQTGSALVLSAAMMMGFLPQGVLGPFIGVFIDRYSRKRIMIISDLLISAASFVMVIAGWMGTLSTGLILADTESGSGSCFIQFLEFERNYLPGRHRGAGSSVHPGNYRDTGTAAGDG